MAREKGAVYPSDHRRWFRIYEDIIDDPKLNSLSPVEFRAYFRLLAMLNRTKCRDGEITFDRYALMACTMRAQLRHSERTMSALEAHGLCAISKDGASYVITVPKWAELQNLAPTYPRHPPAKTPATTPTPKTTPTTKKRVCTRTPKKPATTCPEKLPDSHGANAADWAAARGTGIAELEFRWQRVRRWSDQNPTKRRTALGWYRTLQNAVEDQWGGNPSKPADESPAQGRQRRTREAAAGALEILKRNRDQGPLELHAGGKS